MDIGSIIKNARGEAGLTQEQAAEALGVSRQTISNWETGKTYPDIVSVIRMSDLYHVSLDHLLKEESSVKQTYTPYLEESTDVVRSNERRSRLYLVLLTLGIWGLSLIAFGLIASGVDAYGLSLVVTWTVLPITFFSVSFIIGHRNYYGRWKWLAAPIISILFSLSGFATSVMVENSLYQTVRWPDFTKLPIGLLISLAGLGLGAALRLRQARTRDSEKNQEER